MYVIIIVIICVLAVIWTYFTCCNSFTGGVKTNFNGHETGRRTGLAAYNIDTLTDVATLMPARYARISYKIITDQPLNPKIDSEDQKDLDDLYRLFGVSNVDALYSRLIGILDESGCLDKLSKLNVKQNIINNCLHFVDIARSSEESIPRFRTDFKHSIGPNRPFIGGIEAFICLHMFNDIDLKCTRRLGRGGFNSAYLCYDNQSYNGKKSYVLRVLSTKMEPKAYNNVLMQFKDIASFATKSPWFGKIYHGSHEYNQILNDSSLHPVFWVLTKPYKYISLDTGEMTDELVGNYCNSIANIAKEIHKHNKVYGDWKYDNVMYDEHTNHYVLTDFDLTTPAFHSRFLFRTHNVAFYDTISNALFYNENKSNKFIGKDLKDEVDKFNDSHGEQIGILNDKFIVLKDMFDIVNAIGIEKSDHHTYYHYVRDSTDCSELLDKINNDIVEVRDFLVNQKANDALKLVDETIDILKNIITDDKMFPSLLDIDLTKVTPVNGIVLTVEDVIEMLWLDDDEIAKYIRETYVIPRKSKGNPVEMARITVGLKHQFKKLIGVEPINTV